MDTADTILSFRTPLANADRVEAMPSPVMELVYAFYFLTRDDVDTRAEEVPWLRRLLDGEPELVAAIRSFWPESERAFVGYDLFLMACDLDYARDPTPDRFLAQVADAPRRLRERIDAHADDNDEADVREKFGALDERLARLADPATAATYRDLLTRLWAQLEPLWKGDGLARVREASDAFMVQFRATEDVLAALPPHHFTQFEAAAKQVRASQERGRILVTPLFLASAEGGYNFDVGDVHYIGYGLQRSSAFERRSAELTALAGKLKAFADPTRLMLLAMIARFSRLSLTVGDLAVQLGVSQPTVSGHLKVLREAGLVSLEKQGTKSYYQLDPDAVDALLSDLRKRLLTP